jgi:IS1 family transposase
MSHLSKNDLEQMGEDYFRSLEHEVLVAVAKNLHELAVEQLEKLEETSKNSSRPPSSDDPFRKGKPESTSSLAEASSSSSSEAEKDAETEEAAEEEPSSQTWQKTPKGFGTLARKAGKQPGAKGQWRSTPLKAERIIPHYPEHCAACNGGDLVPDAKPHMGYYQYELVPGEGGFKIECQLHHHYGATCRCGHHTLSQPGEGDISEVSTRKTQLQLQEYVLVGAMLASFIASLAVRYRFSRAKIQEFLSDWYGVELSTGTIDRSIREAGFACAPVVEALLEELQSADILHIDETPWYEAGHFCWLWVVLSCTTVVFMIGQRTKEAFLQLVSSAFVGWLVSDGYGAYRSHPQRQRCLAHLIRKALALAQAVDEDARQLAQWLLEEMRELIHTIATTQQDDPEEPISWRLQQLALMATGSEHPKLKALAWEILNDWSAVVAFVFNPDLPVTNNDAERALRHAVIARRISHGTRSTEGSKAYAALLSVIETCRLRNLKPWTFLAQVIRQRRKGLPAPSLPSVLQAA